MIKGVYEVCIGTENLILAIQYWEQFGYRIGQVGDLPVETVEQLYRVQSSLRSVRLYHQDADHGLIRLMDWEKPVNQGLGMVSMKGQGNRWAATMTTDLLNILNHLEEAVAAGWPVKYTEPAWTTIYKTAGKQRPFVDSLVGVREMMLLQPTTRQILFQRFNYTLPEYGQINPASCFKTSQITHVGVVIQDDSKESLQFYEDVLGLLRVRDDIVDEYATAKASRAIFDLQPGEHYFTTDFDDPRSTKHELQAMRSGRLKIIRFPSAIKLEDRHNESQPGCLGLSLYTYQVQGLEAYFNRVKASKARDITNIVPNEFGERSFSLVAPDGYFWTLVEA